MIKKNVIKEGNLANKNKKASLKFNLSLLEKSLDFNESLALFASHSARHTAW
jgi:hypothetical protein